MKEYTVYYGNNAWIESVGVYAKNEKEAKKIIEKCLRKGVKIIEVKITNK